MLRLIFGRSGSGKTHSVTVRAAELSALGKSAVILVPEQFTFETERALLSAAGPAAGLHIEVLSFTRLVHSVHTRYGGFAGRYVDDTGRLLLMHRALEQVKELLRVYGRQARYPNFTRLLVDTSLEYKRCGVSPETLAKTAPGAGDPVLSGKLTDLSLILGAYEAMLGAQFADSGDDLDRLAEALDEHPWFAGKTVFLDGFKGFTAQEKAVLQRILRQAEDVCVTFCADRLEDAEEGYGAFSPVRESARAVLALAGKTGVPAAPPMKLTESRRFETEALRHLEAHLFEAGAEPFAGQPESIRLISAGNIYDETQFAAQEIARLVREEGLRYRDIVVIARSLEPYRGILDPVFEKYGIPLFFDARQSLETHPLMTLVLCALEMLTGDFRPEPVFRYLKTGLSGFDTMEISMLENYVFTWDIRGLAQWTQNWQGSPEGFEGPGRDDSAELEQLNGIRRRFVEPFVALRGALEAAGGARAMLTALYGFLTAVGADAAVEKARRELAAAGEPELADEYRQIWDKLAQIFTQAALTLADTALSVDGLYELLHLAVAGGEMAHIPPSLDEVMAGDAERIRSGDAKAAFVLGLAEGVFPMAHESGGVLTEAERERLIALGLELSPPEQKRAVEERFFAYKAMTCASRRLYLSYPRSDTRGRAHRPSQFLGAVRALFPALPLQDAAEGGWRHSLQNEASAFEMLALGYRAGGELNAALRAVFSAKPEYALRLAALERAANRRPAVITDRAAARELYGEQMRISPSRIETFQQCRFLYFCRHGLRARTRRKAALMAPEIGTLIHFVLERLLSSSAKGGGLSALSQQELDARIEELLQEFAQSFLGGLENKPERFRYLYARLKETVMALVEHIALELEVSDFVPVDFELPIEFGGAVEPAVLPLPDGGAIAVGGKVDRVDVMQKGGRTYLRVIDYKSGAKTFHLPDVVYGLNLQMFIYLFTLCQNSGTRYAPDGILPAGVLYMPAKRPEISAERGTDEESLRQLSHARMRMNGLVVDDPLVIEGMEHGGRGLFIPAKFRANPKEGESPIDSRSSVASAEKLGVLGRHIERVLLQMARTLRAGDVSAVPVEGLGYRPCEYCEFSSVCGFEKGDAVRYLRAPEDVWQTLKGDETDG